MNDPFYRSAAWRKFRASMLKSFPFCQFPGCSQRSSQVDHKLAVKRGGARLSQSNAICYCATHHSQKTRVYDMAGNKFGGSVKGMRVLGCDDLGRPLDPTHHWNKSNG